MELPAEVSGRPLGPRGVHGPPTDYHGGWCREQGPYPRSYWLDLLQSMGLSWIVLLYSGRSALEAFDGKPVVAWLLDAGVVPVLRYHTTQLPRPFVGDDVVAELAAVYADHGLKPFVQLWNEPGNPREWVDNVVPPGWWGTFIGLWLDAAQRVVAAGGWPGFPDGPDYNYTTRHPFRDTLCDRWLWDGGHAWFGPHPYGLGRPLRHPTDEVSLHGTPITEAEYRAALDDLHLEPSWWEPPPDPMNALRAALANPDPTFWDGQRSDWKACWRSWELADFHSQETLGYSVPLIATEGGWTPRARAGSGPDLDYRWPLDTPKAVGRKCLAAWDQVAATPHFLAACHWLMADEDMGGVGWPFDCWHGWAYSEVIDLDTGEPYGRWKPAVRMARGTLPGGVPEAIARVAEAQGVLEVESAAATARLDAAVAALTGG